MLKVAFLISHKSTGSNLQAVVDAVKRKEIKCKIKLVISSKEGVRAIDVVNKNNLPLVVRPLRDRKSKSERENYGRNLAELMNRRKIDIAILEGFSIILSNLYFKTFRGMTLNIHPGLLPDKKNNPWRFPDKTKAPWNRGLLTNDAVKNFLKLKYAGSTWHIATKKTDLGPILKRVIVSVKTGDTVETLYIRLKTAEHKGLIEILKNFPARQL